MNAKRVVAAILVFIMIFINGFTSFLKPGSFLGIQQVYAASDTTGDNVYFTAHFDLGGSTSTTYKGQTGDREKVLFLTLTNGNNLPLENGKITIQSIRQPVDINMGTISTAADSIVASKTTDRTSYTDAQRPDANATLTLNNLNQETKQIAIGFDQLSDYPNIQFMSDPDYLKKDITFVLTGKVNGVDIQKTATLTFDLTGTLTLSQQHPDIRMKYVDKETGAIRTRQRFYAPAAYITTNKGRLGVEKYVSEIQLPPICGKYPAADKVGISFAHQRVVGAQTYTYDPATGKIVVTAQRADGLGIPVNYRYGSNDHQVFIVDVDAIYDDPYVIDNFEATYKNTSINYTVTNKATADPLYNVDSEQPIPPQVTRTDNTKSINMYSEILPIQFSTAAAYAPSLQQMWVDGKAQFWSYNYAYVNAAGAVDSLSGDITKLQVTYKDANNVAKTRDLVKDEYIIRYVELYRDGGTYSDPFVAGGLLANGYVDMYYTNAGGQKELLNRFDKNHSTSSSPFPRSETGQWVWKNDLNLPVNDLSWVTSAPQGENSNKAAYMLMVVYETTPKLIQNIITETGATEQSFMNGGKGAVTQLTDYRTNKLRWTGDTDYSIVATDVALGRTPIKGGLSTQQSFPDGSKNTVGGPTTSSDVLIAIRLPVNGVPLYSQNPTLYLPFPPETVVESVKLNTSYVSSQRYNNVQLSTFTATNAVGVSTTVAKIKTGDLFYDSTGYATPRYIFLDVKMKSATNAPVGSTAKQLFVYGTSQDGYYYYSASDIWDVDQDGSFSDTIFRSHSDHSPNLTIINSGSLFPELYINHDQASYAPPSVANISRTETFDLTVQLTNRLSGIKAKDTKMLVRLPFVGNKDVKTNQDMGSTFDPVLQSPITLPATIPDGTVYYTTVANATSDLSDPANDWVTTPTDYTTVKNALIDLGSYELGTFTGSATAAPDNVPGMVVVPIPLKIPAGAPMGNIAYAQMQADYTLTESSGVGIETPVTSYTQYPVVKVKRDTSIQVKTIVHNESGQEMASVPGYNLIMTNVKNLGDASQYSFMTATADPGATNANVDEATDVPLGTYEITFPQVVLDFKDYVVTANGVPLTETAPGNRTYAFVISDSVPNQEVVITRTYVPEPVPSLTKPEVTFTDTTLQMPNRKAKYDVGTNSTSITIDHIGNDSMVTPAENVTYTLLNSNGLHIDSISFPAIASPPAGVTVTLEGYKNAQLGAPAVQLGPVTLGSAQTLLMPDYGTSETDYVQVVKVVFNKLPIDTVLDGVTLNVRAKNKVTADTNYSVRVDASGKYKLKNGNMTDIDNTNYQTTESFTTKATMGSVHLQYKHGSVVLKTSDILQGGWYEPFTTPTAPNIVGYRYQEVIPPNPLPQMDGEEAYDPSGRTGYFTDTAYTLVYEYLPIFPLEVVVYGDRDKNNAYNAGDDLLNGYTVTLYKSGDLTTPIDTKVTGVDGKATFVDLYEGSYVYTVENADTINYRVFSGDPLQKSVTLDDTTTAQYARFEFIPIPAPTLSALTITPEQDDLTAPNDLAYYPDTTKPNHTKVMLDNFKNTGNVDLTDTTYTLNFDGATAPLSLQWPGYPSDTTGNQVKFTVKYSDHTEKIFGPVAVTQAQDLDFTAVAEGVTVDEIEAHFTKITSGTNYSGVTLDVAAVEKITENKTSTFTVNRIGNYASRDGSTTETLALETQQVTLNLFAVNGQLVVNYMNYGTPLKTAETQTAPLGELFTVVPPVIEGYTYFRTTINNPLVAKGQTYYNATNYSGRFSDATITVNHEYVVASAHITVTVYNGDKADNDVLNQFEVENINESTPYTLSSIPVISGFSYDATHPDNKLTSLAGETPRYIDVIMKDERKSIEVEIVKDDGVPEAFKTYRLSSGSNLNLIAPEFIGFQFTGYTMEDGDLVPLQNRVVSVQNITNDLTLKLYYKTYQAPIEPEQKKDLIIRYVDEEQKTDILEYQIYDLQVGLPFTHVIQQMNNMGYEYTGPTQQTSVTQTIVSDGDNIITIPFKSMVADVKIQYLEESTLTPLEAEAIQQARVNTPFVAEEKAIPGYYCVNAGESLVVQQNSAENVLTLLYAPIPIPDKTTSGSALVVRHMLSSDGVMRTLKTEKISLDGTEILPGYAYLDAEDYFTYEPINSTVSAELLNEGYDLRNNSNITKHVFVDGNIIDIVYLPQPTEVRVQYFVNGTTEEVAQPVVDNTHSVGAYFIPPIPQKAGYRITRAVTPMQLSAGTNAMTIYYEPIALSGVIQYVNKENGQVLQQASLPSPMTLGQLFTHQAPTELTVGQETYALAEGVKDTAQMMISEDYTQNVIIFYYNVYKKEESDEKDNQEEQIIGERISRRDPIPEPETESEPAPAPNPTPIPIPVPTPSPAPVPNTNETPNTTTKTEENQSVGNTQYSWATYKKPEEIFIDGDLMPLSQLVFNGPYLYGYPDKTIRSNESLTRAEAAQMIYNLYGRPEEYLQMEGNLPYKDVNKEAWYAKAVAFLTQYEVVTGYPDGLFYPNKTITRAELVTMLVKYNEMTDEMDNENIFEDVVNHWAKRQINAACKDHIITGFADGTFKPNNLATRAEAVLMINNMLSRPDQWIGGDEFTDLNENDWAYKKIMNAANGYAEE